MKMSEIRYKKVLPFKEKMKVMFRTVTHPHLKNSVPPYMLFCNHTHTTQHIPPTPMVRINTLLRISDVFKSNKEIMSLLNCC